MKNYVNKTSKLMSCGAMVACLMAQGCGYNETMNYGGNGSQPVKKDEVPTNPNLPLKSRPVSNSNNLNLQRNTVSNRESQISTNSVNRGTIQPTVIVTGPTRMISTTSQQVSSTSKSESSSSFSCFGSKSKKPTEPEKTETSLGNRPSKKVEE